MLELSGGLYAPALLATLLLEKVQHLPFSNRESAKKGRAGAFFNRAASKLSAETPALQAARAGPRACTHADGEYSRSDVKDGLYQVHTNYLTAGFVVEGGRVVDCAPILRRKLGYWMTIARLVREGGNEQA